MPNVERLDALAEGGKTLEGPVFYSGDSDVIMSCLICSIESG